MNSLQFVLWLLVILLKCFWALNLCLSPFSTEKKEFLKYDLQ